MGLRSREVLLLAACALALCEAVNKTTKKDAKDSENILNSFEDYDSSANDQEVLLSEDRPCPRDCICTVSQGYRIAKCNRLEAGTQKFGDDITDLVIENSEIPIQLDDLIFKKLGLHRIATIKIVNTTITSVAHNAFHGLRDLYAVNLSNNKLKSLHPDMFASNKKLLLLTLSYNPLKFPTAGSEDYFLNTTSLQELDISYCNMKFTTAHTFKYMPALMYLNVAGNHLSDMNPETFNKLLDLEELDLSDNEIKYLPADIFSENGELVTLHIQKNPIDTVLDLQISDLLTLNAGQTQIKFIGPSMFSGMIYIANLNLSGNNIEKIHNQAFHKLVELNYLDLSYNDLDFISSMLIKENIELDIFKISNNPKLKYLPAEGFLCSADQFNIYLFDASNCGLVEISDNSLKTFTALSQINLSGNNINSISNEVFSRSPKLVEINLSYNKISKLDDKVFEKNKDLGKLYLQGNPLKVLSAEMFVHIPVLSWLDVSHAELTSLWKVGKNHPVTLLNSLSFLNVSHNRINEIKQNQLETLKKLQTFDISNNPLVCNREFENLMTWLTKRKVSPNAKLASFANLAKDAKDEDVTYSWDFLSRKACGSVVEHPVQPLLPVVDEEIWERIDKDADGNFDLKNTLDDGKVADDTKLPTDDKLTPIDDDKDADDDEDEDDEEGDDDDYESGEDYGDDDDDDDVDLKVKLFDKQPAKVPSSKYVTSAPREEKVKLDIKLLENDSMYDDIEPDVDVVMHLKEADHNRYEYMWPMFIAIVGALLLLIVIAKVVTVMCSKKSNQVRYNSAIIAAMSQQNRTKKDCGAVYQQLSEDLSGPKTPKLSRYQPLQSVSVSATNMTYESSPFHHNNIVPESV